jgi:hypothetical protein
MVSWPTLTTLYWPPPSVMALLLEPALMVSDPAPRSTTVSAPPPVWIAQLPTSVTGMLIRLLPAPVTTVPDPPLA